MAKKWSELADSTRRKYERQGVTAKGYNAARNAKSWNNLSKGYRSRLERNGITKERWSSPVARSQNTDLFAQARGHGGKAWTVQRAEQRNIAEHIPGFSRLPRNEQIALAEHYQEAFFTANRDRVIVPDTRPGREFRFGNQYIPERDLGGLEAFEPGMKHVPATGWVMPDETKKLQLSFLKVAEAYGNDLSDEEYLLLRELYRQLAAEERAGNTVNWRPFYELARG